jgi:peptidyl-prolyl cis-trans isomerase C
MNYSRFLVVAALLALAACQPKATDSAAGPAKDVEPPVATVNGEAIGSDFFDFYAKGVAGKPAGELTAEQREQALDNLIRAKLVAQQAAKDGLDKDPETASMVELQRLNVLQQVSSERYLKDKKPTEQELRAEYETQVASLPRLEYHARHILVATSQFAEKLIADLEKGADFAALAKRESMDGSKGNGGDLGWFTTDRMVKPFTDAIVALKPGQYTRTPVKTQYGWHVIKLEDTRDVAAPPFDQVRQRLEQMVLAKKFKTYTDELLKTAKVEKKAAPAAADGAVAPAAPATTDAQKPTGG